MRYIHVYILWHNFFFTSKLYIKTYITFDWVHMTTHFLKSHKYFVESCADGSNFILIFGVSSLACSLTSLLIFAMRSLLVSREARSWTLPAQANVAQIDEGSYASMCR